MQTLIQITIPILLLSFPIFLFIIYIKTLESKSKQALKLLMSESSEVYPDLRVWVKNFDIFKKKNKFELDPFQTTYDFNECDLILNPNNLVIVGNTKILGKRIVLRPTIFSFEKQNMHKQGDSVIVECNACRVNGADLEIDFFDPAYLNVLTLVIKRIDNQLKEKIKTGCTSGNFILKSASNHNPLNQNKWDIL